MTVESLLQEIRALAVPERKRLIGLIVDTLTDEPDEPTKQHSILEFEGVGADMWASVDVRSYLDALRNEWDAPK